MLLVCAEYMVKILGSFVLSEVCYRSYTIFYRHDSIAYYGRETLIQEGVALTTKSFHSARESSLSSDSDTDEESNVHKLLGGGKGWYVSL